MPGKKVVIPYHWIHGLHSQLPKYLNNSLNKNQTVLVYYSNAAIKEIERGAPAERFPPDFQQNIHLVRASNEINDGLRDGCYFANPCKCACKYSLKFKFIFNKIKFKM